MSLSLELRLLMIRLCILLTLGIVMGAITYGVSGAGGFFTVDGQSVKYNSDIDAVVGFCLASSRICCETGKTCADGVQMCNTNSSFLNAQQWPWILIYSFVILVVFVCVWYVSRCLSFC